MEKKNIHIQNIYYVYVCVYIPPIYGSTRCCKMCNANARRECYVYVKCRSHNAPEKIGSERGEAVAEVCRKCCECTKEATALL